MFRHWVSQAKLGRWRQRIAGASVLVAAIFLLAPTTVFGQLSTGLEIAGSTGLGTSNPKTIIINIIRIFLGFLGLVAVVIILYGGFKWMTSAGADDKVKQARKIIINGVIGLVIVLASFLIVTFVINLFGGALTGGGNGNETPVPPEFHYGALGGGVLRDVYPIPGAKDVARNTLIMVSFKEAIALSSLIDHSGNKPSQCSAPAWASSSCGYLAKTGSGTTASANLKIYNLTQSAGTSLPFDRAIIMTNDGKTFVIKPIDYLGSSNSYSNYKVILSANIQLARNNAPAFSGTGYGWLFTVSNILDLTPPKVVSVIPTLAASSVVKNSLVQINFSEAVNAITASGRVILGNLTNGVGSQADFDANSNPFKIINISYLDANGGKVYVAGEFIISNGFKTVEFVPTAQCTNSSGQAVQNSCGRSVFCLPGNQSLSVLALAALVNAASHETTDILSGVTDAAGNSLDGNNNGTANGAPTDNYSWRFATSDNLDLTPPQVILPLTPAHNQNGVPVNVKPSVQFNKLMRSSSLINDYFGVITNGFSGNNSCTSSATRLDVNDPTPNAAPLPFPPESWTACYPVGYNVAKENVWVPSLSATATQASLHLFGRLNDNTDYVNRLSDKIQDINQNCFNPAECVPGQVNCPDQTGHN